MMDSPQNNNSDKSQNSSNSLNTSVKKNEIRDKTKLRGKNLFFIVIIFIVVFSGIFVWQWYKTNKLVAQKFLQQQNSIISLHNSLKAVVNETNAIKTELKTTSEKSIRQSQFQQTEKNISRLSDQIAELEHQVNSVKNKLKTFHPVKNHLSENWQLSNVAFMLNLANYQLYHLYNYEGCLLSLTAAQKYLRPISNTELTPIKLILFDEIAAIKNFHYPKREPLILKLQKISAAINPYSTLQLSRSDKAISSPNNEKDTSQNWIQRIINRLRKSISDNIVIEYQHIPVLSIAQKNHEVFLKQIIVLHLQEASIAILNRNNELFHIQLSKIKTLIQKNSSYFQNNTALIREVTKLNSINISPTPPQIGIALNRLKELIAKLNGNNLPAGSKK